MKVGQKGIFQKEILYFSFFRHLFGFSGNSSTPEKRLICSILNLNLVSCWSCNLFLVWTCWQFLCSPLRWSLKKATVWIRVLEIFTFWDAFCDLTDNFKYHFFFLYKNSVPNQMSINGNCTSSLITYSKKCSPQIFFCSCCLTKSCPTNCTHEIFMSFIPFILHWVAVESSRVPLLKLIGLVVCLEMVKAGTVLTVLLPHGDGLSHFWEEFPPTPQVLLS